jgi:hypothetical protein
MAAKLFGMLFFGAMGLVFAAWTVRDFMRGEATIVPMGIVSRAGKPGWFWTQMIVQGLFAAACLFGVVGIALTYGFSQ